MFPQLSNVPNIDAKKLLLKLFIFVVILFPFTGQGQTDISAFIIFGGNFSPVHNFQRDIRRLNLGPPAYWTKLEARGDKLDIPSVRCCLASVYVPRTHQVPTLLKIILFDVYIE